MNPIIEEFICNAAYKFNKCHSQHGENVKSILVIRTDVLGDMVITIPFFRELRRAYPDSHITLVCNQSIYNLVEPMPYVDKILTVQQIRGGKHLFERRVLGAYKFAKKYLRDKVYDLAINPTYPAYYPEERIMISFAKAKRRVMYVQDEKTGEVTLTETDYCVSQGIKHVIDRTFDLLEALGHRIENDDLELFTTEEDVRYISSLFAECGIRENSLKAVVCMSSGSGDKDWGADRFAEVAKWLHQSYCAEIILLGDKKRTEAYGKEFLQICPKAHNFIGRTTLRQVVEIMRRSDLHIGGDTGTLHIAVACDMKGVAIYKDWVGAHIQGGLAHETFRPWKSDIKVIQPKSPLPGCEDMCHVFHRPHCIRQVSAEEVIEELDKILKAGK